MATIAVKMICGKPHKRIRCTDCKEPIWTSVENQTVTCAQCIRDRFVGPILSAVLLDVTVGNGFLEPATPWSEARYNG